MMKVWWIVALMSSMGAAKPQKGIIEFGEFHLKEAIMSDRKGPKEAKLLRKVGPRPSTPKPEPILDDDKNWPDLSFSFGSFGRPSSSPNRQPTPPLAPSIQPPSVSPPTVSPAPASVPTGSLAPANQVPTAPSFFTTAPVAEGPTLVPTPEPSPSVNLEKVVFTCTPEGVETVDPPYDIATVIDFEVGYLVESATFFEDFQDELNNLILETTVIAVLECSPGGPIFGPGGTIPTVPMFTAITGEQCVTQTPGDVCTVLETSFRVVVDRDLDPSLSAFVGYVALQQKMDNGTFEAVIAALDRIEYMHPLPLLPPIIGNDQPTPAPLTSPNSLSVSPWTLGAVLAMCVGGFVAIYVWARNRRTRNRRHMQLLEDVSMASPPSSMATEQVAQAN